MTIVFFASLSQAVVQSKALAINLLGVCGYSVYKVGVGLFYEWKIAIVGNLIFVVCRGGTGIWPGPGPRVLRHRAGAGSIRVLAHTKTGTEKK